ncbi:myoD family inhibitor domain-containing protein-like isoform X2 [Nerophis ophidion]|uniref:myoD family inhibitor domain-containing protein-like isoform X2 n=1 Tax=Nerophis ophidion TaxID=159077 RepID=UPI002AE01194|nr:myoD family inhibitor domain-containing protein-like isoform X2 [Nerophis ophidion]
MPTAELIVKASTVTPQHVPRAPNMCPRCGLELPNDIPGGPCLSAQSSKQHAATNSDRCAHLLLACLSCQCSALLPDSCSLALCSPCCRTCARCCAVVRGAPVEELNCSAHCHAVLVQSCCEPTQCLEFCLECCQICHRN